MNEQMNKQTNKWNDLINKRFNNNGHVLSVKTYFDPMRFVFSAAWENFDPVSGFDAASLSLCQDQHARKYVKSHRLKWSIINYTVYCVVPRCPKISDKPRFKQT